MTTRVAIDPNVRLGRNGTYAGFEDVEGPLVSSGEVEVYESESGIKGIGTITNLDFMRQLIFLSVDWKTLTEASSTPG